MRMKEMRDNINILTTINFMNVFENLEKIEVVQNEAENITRIYKSGSVNDDEEHIKTTIEDINELHQEIIDSVFIMTDYWKKITTKENALRKCIDELIEVLDNAELFIKK